MKTECVSRAWNSYRAKHVCPEYGVITPEPAADWRTGIPYREGDFALWCIEVGTPKDLGLLLKCAPSCISKKNMLAFWDMFGEIFGAPHARGAYQYNR